MYELVEIDRNDLELLRIIKNSYRQYFFDNRKINKARQILWYDDKYIQSSDQTIYKIIVNGKVCGVFGVYERSENRLELFNLIVVRKNRIKGIFSKVIRDFCSDHSSKGKICFVSVLKLNPAIRWYMFVGFIVSSQNDIFVELEYKND